MFIFAVTPPVSKAQKIPGAAILLLAKLGAGIADCKSRRESCRILCASSELSIMSPLKPFHGANPETKQVLLCVHCKGVNLPEISRMSQEPL